jgi:hypothetical protein
MKTGKSWWAAPGKNIQWEVYVTDEGHTFPDSKTAREVVTSLSGD